MKRIFILKTEMKTLNDIVVIFLTIPTIMPAGPYQMAYLKKKSSIVILFSCNIILFLWL